MAIKIMAQVWDSERLAGVELLTALALADFANNEAECFPKMATIARRTRQSERNARRMVSRLVFLGAVSRKRARYTNLYRLNLKFFRPDDTVRSASSAKAGRSSVRQNRQKTRQEIRQREKACAPKNGAPTDPRHTAIIEVYVVEFERRHPSLRAPVDGSDGKALRELLRQQSTASTEEITTWLLNAFNSDDVPPLRPCFRLREFASHALKYTRGPLHRSGSRASGALTQPPGKYANLKPDAVV